MLAIFHPKNSRIDNWTIVKRMQSMMDISQCEASLFESVKEIDTAPTHFIELPQIHFPYLRFLRVPGIGNWPNAPQTTLWSRAWRGQSARSYGRPVVANGHFLQNRFHRVRARRWCFCECPSLSENFRKYSSVEGNVTVAGNCAWESGDFSNKEGKILVTNFLVLTIWDFWI